MTPSIPREQVQPDNSAKSSEANKISNRKETKRTDERNILSSQRIEEDETNKTLPTSIQSRQPIIAGIASVPSRREHLHAVINSILPQVDHIELVLNGYAEIPDWLTDDRITIARSQDIGDHADNGKFIGLSKYSKCIYFTIDDDILYPPNYAAKLLDARDRYKGLVTVGVHGSFVPEPGGSFLNRRTHSFSKELLHDCPCSFVGTGTMAINRELLPLSPISIFTDTGASDLFIAKYLKHKRIPVICISRPNEWLRTLPSLGEESLWEKARQNCTKQDEILKKAGPWGMDDIIDRCKNLMVTALSQEVQFALDISRQITSTETVPDSARKKLSQYWPSTRKIIETYLGKEVCQKHNLYSLSRGRQETAQRLDASHYSNQRG